MTVVESSRTVAPRGGGRAPDRGFRPEVQGLRALAVLMVVAYHVWFGRVSGGVDVFLLISAFLLALSFLRKVESGRPLDLGRHWLHQFKRLLPAVVVVILGTLGATYLLVPRSRWTDILEQAWASLFYVQNWVLASNAVDYYADDHSLASPLQHFWSLSVQGQVFILWPLLFVLSALVARRFRLRFRGVVLLVFGALFVASLGFSVWETSTNQAYAYFDTRARLWEFALGTLLALALPFLRLPRVLRIMAGWLGVGAMLSGGFLLDVQGQFPGYVALWPLLAAALVIAAGQTGSAVGADRFLLSRPLVRMGDLSYALYLWHWPVLVLFLIWRDAAAPGILGGLVVIAVSLVLAYLTMRFVERPLRALAWADRRRRRSVIVLAVCLTLVAAPLAGWQREIRLESERIAAQADTNNPGARIFDTDYVDQTDPDAPLVPTADVGGRDYANVLTPCTGRFATEAGALQGLNCSIIVDQAEPSRTIVAVGNSHVQQWLATMKPLAEENGWALVALVRGGCQFGGFVEAVAAECNERNAQAKDYIADLRPDLVFTTGTYSVSEPPFELLPGGFSRGASELIEQGIPVLAIRDNPRFTRNMMECAEDFGESAQECNVREEEVRDMSGVTPIQQMADITPGLKVMDLNDYVCFSGSCPAVIGNMRVYLDDNHLTSTYARTLSPYFFERMMAATGW
ncbi:acyltransferase family protein [Arthrobacter bussei]|uniref:Acyltransferase n=1 Tax=Arthrobacter bussei TaxID=2594179 RepID=A0A7X1NMF3_9MICC|nr:acyltransferase family protein [Arthrobacter bussei]MPY09526.1 acyltransferase [Arthrobacter bussei]